MNKMELELYSMFVAADGLYESPKDKFGNYKGPLVPYAGTYPDGNGNKLNFVGFSYFNIAKIEEYCFTRTPFANALVGKISTFGRPNILIGAPMGGIIFATTIADMLSCSIAFFEKKITELGDSTKGTKEKSELIFNRHCLNKGDKVILLEDLCNNFSTTDKMIDLVFSQGAEVTAIACILNRSKLESWKGIPVITLLHIPTPEYKQTDPEVQHLIATSKIVWKPKQEWTKLREAMQNG